VTTGSRPLIGITSYAQPARWGAWELPAALVPLYYVESVHAAGGRALVVPPSDDAIEETLDVLDGLVFSGGIDIDPARYGAERHPATDPAQAHRDEGELALLEAALARDLPVLAICRGAQLLNVAHGGDLVQHLPEVVGHDRHRHQPGAFSDHEVAIEEGTTLWKLVGSRTEVKSHHHQGLGRLGHGLRFAAHAEDGSPEAIEAPARPFAIGVLWHPEAGDDLRLFEALVEEAVRHRAEREA
jgi:putative glutamine amidotransferase